MRRKRRVKKGAGKKGRSRAALKKEVVALGKMLRKAVARAAKSREVAGIKSKVRRDIAHISGRIRKAVAKAESSRDRRAIEAQARKVVGLGQRQAKQTLSRLKKRGVRKAKKLRGEFWKGTEASVYELARLSQKLKSKARRQLKRFKK